MYMYNMMNRNFEQLVYRKDWRERERKKKEKKIPALNMA